MLVLFLSSSTLQALMLNSLFTNVIRNLVSSRIVSWTYCWGLGLCFYLFVVGSLYFLFSFCSVMYLKDISHDFWYNLGCRQKWIVNCLFFSYKLVIFSFWFHISFTILTHINFVYLRSPFMTYTSRSDLMSLLWWGFYRSVGDNIFFYTVLFESLTW